MTRREKLQAAAFLLCGLAAVIIEAYTLAAGVMVAAAGGLTVLSYRVRG